MIERGVDSTLLRVSVRSNPPANVTWKTNGREISRFDSHYTFLPDGSLQMHKVATDHPKDQEASRGPNRSPSGPLAEPPVHVQPPE